MPFFESMNLYSDVIFFRYNYSFTVCVSLVREFEKCVVYDSEQVFVITASNG